MLRARCVAAFVMLAGSSFVGPAAAGEPPVFCSMSYTSLDNSLVPETTCTFQCQPAFPGDRHLLLSVIGLWPFAEAELVCPGEYLSCTVPPPRIGEVFTECRTEGSNAVAGYGTCRVKGPLTISASCQSNAP